MVHPQKYDSLKFPTECQNQFIYKWVWESLPYELYIPAVRCDWGEEFGLACTNPLSLTYNELHVHMHESSIMQLQALISTTRLHPDRTVRPRFILWQGNLLDTRFIVSQSYVLKKKPDPPNIRVYKHTSIQHIIIMIVCRLLNSSTNGWVDSKVKSLPASQPHPLFRTIIIISFV